MQPHQRPLRVSNNLRRWYESAQACPAVTTLAELPRARAFDRQDVPGTLQLPGMSDFRPLAPWRPQKRRRTCHWRRGAAAATSPRRSGTAPSAPPPVHTPSSVRASASWRLSRSKHSWVMACPCHGHGCRGWRSAQRRATGWLSSPRLDKTLGQCSPAVRGPADCRQRPNGAVTLPASIRGPGEASSSRLTKNLKSFVWSTLAGVDVPFRSVHDRTVHLGSHPLFQAPSRNTATMTLCMRLPPFLIRGTTSEGPLPERSTNLCSEKITSLNARSTCCGHTAHPGCNGACERLCERLVQTKPRLAIDDIECMSWRRPDLARLGRAGRGRAARGVAAIRARPSLHPQLQRSSAMACRPAVRLRTLTRLRIQCVCADLVFLCPYKRYFCTRPRCIPLHNKPVTGSAKTEAFIKYLVQICS